MAELQKIESPYLINMSQPVAVLTGEQSFPMVLGMIPWGHQTDIVSKCKSIDEAIFYLRECILGGWSRHTLNNALKANLYKSYGKAISNFREYLPEAQSRMAQEITKDNYDFGFFNSIDLYSLSYSPSYPSLLFLKGMSVRMKLLLMKLCAKHS